MIKKIPLVFSFIAACALIMGVARVQGQAQVAPLATSLVNGSTSPVARFYDATPTVGYQNTAQAAITALSVAQATADEARKVNAQATAQHEQYLGIAAQATMSGNDLEMARIWMTATHAPTAIAAQATDQAAKLSIADMRLQETKINATTTAAAPALMRDMKFAEAYNGAADFWARVFAFLGIGVFTIAVPVALFTVPRKSVGGKMSPTETPAPMDYKPIPAAPINETVIQVKRDEGSYPRMDRFVIPVSAEKFDVFVRGVILERKPLAVNEWEGAESPFKNRDEYMRMRAFMQSNKLAESAGGGKLTMTVAGEEVFHAWIDAGALPTQYHFPDIGNMEA